MGQAVLKTRGLLLGPDIRITPGDIKRPYKKGFVCVSGCFSLDADYQGATSRYGRTWPAGGLDWGPSGPRNLGATSFDEIVEKSVGIKSPGRLHKR